MQDSLFFYPTGYADDEDARQTAEDNNESHHRVKVKQRGFMPPEDIEDDNLAADFDGSLSGLGVEMHTGATFSMSEALNALPNLSISSSQIFKQEIPSPTRQILSNSNSKSNNNEGCKQDKLDKTYGALDLSNDEAFLPDSNDDGSGEKESPGPMTFTGSVSRDSTPSLDFSQKFTSTSSSLSKPQPSGSKYSVKLSASNPNLSAASTTASSSVEAAANKSHKVILQQQLQQQQQQQQQQSSSADNMKLEKRSYETLATIINNPNEITTDSNVFGVVAARSGGNSSNFQYILAASTSTATKLNEPSITYLNQGQAYELRLKKLGDLSPYRKRMLQCVMRICFHERRLQYMEAEQITEWSAKHPSERIIDVDLPLSYGVLEPVRDVNYINSVSFKWDPTRDTGVFIKVNCISTEFTPKKHGGEKGVPFRLQVETYDNDSRVNAAGCILQVFKLKGADRKHKQDREKISKRALSEQEKFAPSFDCTVLTELPNENIYVPTTVSRSGTPIHCSPYVVESPVAGGSNDVINDVPSMLARVDSSEDKDMLNESFQPPTNFNHLEGSFMDTTASVSQVTAWLMANRYSAQLSIFRNFNGRDMSRLLREEIILLSGPSDGIRLYNDLHMVEVPPRKTFYVGPKDNGDNEYTALYLEELTVQDLVKSLADAFGIASAIFSSVFIVGPRGIHVRVTDDVVRRAKPETVFQFSLRSSKSSGTDASCACDVILEEVLAVQCVSNDNPPAATLNSVNSN
jgi:transcription factor CP2-like protein